MPTHNGAAAKGLRPQKPQVSPDKNHRDGTWATENPGARGPAGRDDGERERQPRTLADEESRLGRGWRAGLSRLAVRVIKSNPQTKTGGV